MNIYNDSQNDFNEKIIFPSVFANISYSEKIINILGQKLKISDEIFGNILLSLSEAINNAIVHGNKFTKDKNVTVTYSYKSSNKTLVVEVIDEGDGFDPNEINDPTDAENIEKLYGRGVFIIISLTDKVEFEYNNGQIVRMYFNIEP